MKSGLISAWWISSTPRIKTVDALMKLDLAAGVGRPDKAELRITGK